MICTAVLGYSRFAYVADEWLKALPACHKAAFAFIDGTLHEGPYHNMRMVVVGRDVDGLGSHRLSAVCARVFAAVFAGEEGPTH